jgi:hypothetical protein
MTSYSSGSPDQSSVVKTRDELAPFTAGEVTANLTVCDRSSGYSVLTLECRFDLCSLDQKFRVRGTVL